MRLTATKSAEGQWIARFSGPKLEGAREFRTLAAANRYLVRSFAAMFPEHRCTKRCRGGED